jgi:hypothetical protein
MKLNYITYVHIAESLKFNPRYVTIIASAVFKWICSPLTITVTNTGCFKLECFLVKSLIFFRQIVRLEEFKRIQGEKWNGILLPKLFWPIVLFSDWEKRLKIEAEGQEFAKFLRSLEQCIQAMNGQNIFGNRMLF